MGESRAPNISRMGDVVLINTGDGEYIEGRPSHNTQIK